VVTGPLPYSGAVKAFPSPLAWTLGILIKGTRGEACLYDGAADPRRFSETLMPDERILSVRERELLTSLPQNTKAASNREQCEFRANFDL
jgi:hypothetical protein